jgi:hypothetical protein
LRDGVFFYKVVRGENKNVRRKSFVKKTTQAELSSTLTQLFCFSLIYLDHLEKIYSLRFGIRFECSGSGDFRSRRISLLGQQRKKSDPETELNGNGWFIKAVFRIFVKGGGTKPIIHPLQQIRR